MKLPRVQGDIRRRLLVNFRVDPDVIRAQLPDEFEPKLLGGSAVAGICLIRLEHERPPYLPAFLGAASENAAHRIAVRSRADGQDAVYIPRRDTDSPLNRLLGGRLFPGEHHAGAFDVDDTGGRIAIEMRSRDGSVAVEVRGREAAALPASSRFGSLDEASAFFATGALGYSATRRGDHLDGVFLATKSWAVRPLAVDHVFSSYFADERRFPPGSVEFDSALVMRDIAHEWVTRDELYLDVPTVRPAA